LIYVFLHVVGTLVCLGTCPEAWKWPAFSNACLRSPKMYLYSDYSDLDFSLLQSIELQIQL